MLSPLTAAAGAEVDFPLRESTAPAPPEVAAFPAEGRKASAPPVKGRILHVINGEHYSGAERVQDLLGLRLAEFGYEMGFCCLKPGKFPSQRRCQSIPLFELPMTSKLDLWTAWELSRQIVIGDYDLVHTHTPRSALVGRIASALAGVPLVHHVHSPTSRDSTKSWTNWVNAATERASLTAVAKLVCVSEALGRHMESDGFSRDRIAVVPNGVPAPEAIRSSKTPEFPWQLGMVALFRPRKGLEVLLEALARLRQSGLKVELKAVGPFETPEYEKTIRDLTKSLGLESAVQWVGFVDDVNRELRKMDLMILPSVFGEGLPMVVLEAMAAGVPVVATRIDGLPEAIRHGIDGLLAEPESAESLAKEIEAIVRGEVAWSSLRDSAMARHASLFSDRAMALGVSRVYDELLK